MPGEPSEGQRLLFDQVPACYGQRQCDREAGCQEQGEPKPLKVKMREYLHDRVTVKIEPVAVISTQAFLKIDQRHMCRQYQKSGRKHER